MRFQHGTRYGYSGAGCRCAECRAAWAEIQRRGRAARAAAAGFRTDLTHGTKATYVNHGCRCEPCVQAQREANARRPQRPGGR